MFLKNRQLKIQLEIQLLQATLISFTDSYTTKTIRMSLMIIGWIFDLIKGAFDSRPKSLTAEKRRPGFATSRVCGKAIFLVRAPHSAVLEIRRQ